MTLKGPMSVLLLDDNPALVRLYKTQLERLANFQVTTATEGWRAKLLADRQLFDVVVTDAKLEYRGSQYGGLRLADDLGGRYGINSILVISRFITAETMKEYGSSCQFLEKHDSGDGTGFGKELCKKIRSMRSLQYAFVAMPFAADHLPFYEKCIRAGVERAGFRCVRMDKVPHNGRIHELMVDLITKSKFVVFLADGANPNAYYEAGFADAMQKEVVTVARSTGDLRFDVAGRNMLAYGEKKAGLAADLCAKITAIRLHAPLNG